MSDLTQPTNFYRNYLKYIRTTTPTRAQFRCWNYLCRLIVIDQEKAFEIILELLLQASSNEEVEMMGADHLEDLIKTGNRNVCQKIFTQAKTNSKLRQALRSTQIGPNLEIFKYFNSLQDQLNSLE